MAYREKDTKKWTAQWFETNVMGEKKKRRKRGFETKREALEFERSKKLSSERSMDMKLSDFIEIYFSDKQNDLNSEAVKLSNTNLNFTCQEKSKIFTKQGNANNLSFIKDESIDLICTHPPYADIIRYSKEIPGDISHLKYKDFLQELEQVAKESYRVLKKQGICAFMIGDIRKKGYVLPLGMNSMQKFVDTGFKFKEIVIKEQHNCRSTDYWEGKERKFLMLAHEYIFILEKADDHNPI